MAELSIFILLLSTNVAAVPQTATPAQSPFTLAAIILSFFMQKFSTVLLIVILLGCSEKKFIRSEILAQYPTDTVYYEAFQTGIDNYLVAFKSKNSSKVEHLFDYYLNDAALSQGTLQPVVKGDTILVFTAHPIENQTIKTKNGRLVQMRNF